MNNRHFASNRNYVITSDEATPLLYGGFTFNDFKLRWNSHRIRPSKKAGCPPGVPNDLYLLPVISGQLFSKKPGHHLTIHDCIKLLGANSSYKRAIDIAVWMQERHPPFILKNL